MSVVSSLHLPRSASLKNPQRGSSCSRSKQKIATSVVDLILERLRKNRVSETIVEHIANARQRRSETNYKSSWRIWASWCDKQQIDAFSCDVILILDYLAFLSEKAYEYRTIGCYRSTVSAFHDFVGKLGNQLVNTQNSVP